MSNNSENNLTEFCAATISKEFKKIIQVMKAAMPDRDFVDQDNIRNLAEKISLENYKSCVQSHKSNSR